MLVLRSTASTSSTLLYKNSYYEDVGAVHLLKTSVTLRCNLAHSKYVDLGRRRSAAQMRAQVVAG